jgi:hypothetical protein
MVEGDLGGKDRIGKRLGGALRVLVPPAVLVLGVGAGGVAVESFRVFQNTSLNR